MHSHASCVYRCSRCLTMKRAFENAATRMAGKVSNFDRNVECKTSINVLIQYVYSKKLFNIKLCGGGQTFM